MIIIVVEKWPHLDPRIESSFSKSENWIKLNRAWAPSTLVLPNIASLLAGSNPSFHGVHWNDTDYLPPEIQTLPEVLIEKHYRTAFFSGAFPIVRKTGINQGFELFDDNISPNINRPWRRMQKSLDRYFRWQREEVNGQSSLAVFYVPDLVFDEIDPDRESIFDSWEKLEAQIQRLKSFLVEKKVFDNTLIAVVGLSYPENLDIDTTESYRASILLHGTGFKEKLAGTADQDWTLKDLKGFFESVLFKSPFELVFHADFDNPWKEQNNLPDDKSAPGWMRKNGPAWLYPNLEKNLLQQFKNDERKYSQSPRWRKWALQIGLEREDWAFVKRINRLEKNQPVDFILSSQEHPVDKFKAADLPVGFELVADILGTEKRKPTNRMFIHDLNNLTLLKWNAAMGFRWLDQERESELPFHQTLIFKSKSFKSYRKLMLSQPKENTLLDPSKMDSPDEF